MTTSEQRAELVRRARTITRTGFHDAAADAYRWWIEKLADALEASEADLQRSMPIPGDHPGLIRVAQELRRAIDEAEGGE